MATVMNYTNPYLQIKLQSSRNYAAWKTQFEPLINLHNLAGHLSGAESAPPTEITFSTTPETTTLIPNPAYQAWFHRDQMLLSWIQSSVSQTVFFHIIGKTSAYKAWEALRQAYGSASQHQQFKLRVDLQSLKPPSVNYTVGQYLQWAKGVADELRVTGVAISDSEMNAIVYRNLGDEYRDVIVSAINQKQDQPLTFQELYGKLIAHKVMLKRKPSFGSRFRKCVNENWAELVLLAYLCTSFSVLAYLCRPLCRR